LVRFRRIVTPFLATLDAVGVPEKADLERWQKIGVRRDALRVTGNVKFDPAGAALPRRRPEFAEMLAAFPRKPVALAVSTFAGEEEFLDAAFREAGYLPVLVPRHAERRAEVVAALGGRAVLRSRFVPPESDETFVIDSTGELRDWTAHAEVVVIGKSFFERGGQNPSEAIQAGVPVICGPHMENFEPLVSELKEAGGIRMAGNRRELLAALCKPDPGGTRAAREVLAKHKGAVDRTIALFEGVSRSF
jgi:3-deoxy-D-manno-octulosonic-acid transferase